ncbi:Zinc finger protein 878 [Papilio machaon]|uniref:Zinc finger protein 878 n=1 Tax=Papilio machaon TaxID=76193 RepID=A0A0N1PGE1_PAPMA|nr:Zinc finger protein 878 [Papilio machaon]
MSTSKREQQGHPGQAVNHLHMVMPCDPRAIAMETLPSTNTSTSHQRGRRQSRGHQIYQRGHVTQMRRTKGADTMHDLQEEIHRKMFTCTYDVVLLCWECRSILKKTWKFRQRIQQAQLLLKTPEFYLNFSTSTLSTLQSTVINNNCEIVCENEKKVKLEIEEEFNDLDDKNDRNDDISNEEDIRIEPKGEIFNNIVLEEDINKEFNKINTSFEDEMYNEVKSDETIQYKTKEEIFNKEVERKKTNKRKKNIEIEIPIINESDLDDKVFDDDISDEEINNKSPEENLQNPKKKKKIIPEQRPCRYKKRELITKNTTNMERFYVKNDVNEKVIEEILDRRLSIKYSGKPKNKCRLCNIMFKREIDLRRHKTLKHFPYFISGYSLRTHRKSVHERKYPPKNKICDICGKGFNRIIKKPGSKPRRNKTMTDKPTPFGFLCNECNMNFDTHTTPQPRVECTICHKLVRTDLSRAHARTHAPRNTYACALCVKTFASRASYEHHLKYTKTHAVIDINNSAILKIAVTCLMRILRNRLRTTVFGHD